MHQLLFGRHRVRGAVRAAVEPGPGPCSPSRADLVLGHPGGQQLLPVQDGRQRCAGFGRHPTMLTFPRRRARPSAPDCGQLTPWGQLASVTWRTGTRSTAAVRPESEPSNNPAASQQPPRTLSGSSAVVTTSPEPPQPRRPRHPAVSNNRRARCPEQLRCHDEPGTRRSPVRPLATAPAASQQPPRTLPRSSRGCDEPTRRPASRRTPPTAHPPQRHEGGPTEVGPPSS